MPPKTSVVWLSISGALFSDVTKKGSNAAVPDQVGVIDTWNEQKRAEQESPVDPRQDDDPTEELNQCLAWVVQHAEDQLANTAGIFSQQT